MKETLKTKKKVKIICIFRTILVAIIILIVAWGYRFSADADVYSYRPFITINNGWTQIIDGQAHSIETAQDAIPIDIGEPTILEHTIYMQENVRQLLFYVEHQEVEVYIDDELMYSLVCPEGMELFGSTGKRWVEVVIPAEANGKTLRLVISSDFKAYQTMPTNIYWLQRGDVQMVQNSNMWGRNIAALTLLVLSILSYVNASMWKNERLRRYLFGLGDLYLLITLWLCAELNILALVFGRISISSMLAMVFIRMIPIVFYHVSVFADKEQSSWMSFVGIFVWANLILALILQFIFGISLVSQLAGYAIAICIGTGICLVGMLRQFITKPYTRYVKGIYYCSFVLLLAALGESLCYLFHGSLGQYTGISVSIGGIVYGSLVHIFLVRNESINEVEKRELEAHFKELRKKPLTSQINAHFLGNALNSISAYCKEDPEKADRAVQLLGKYMREYMHLVDTGDDVYVEDELYLVQLYYEIQKTRFGDAIQFEIINEFDDFQLPPLSLQPLVENAVWHGIRSSIEEGVVKIKTMKSNNMGVVIISDNGVGFEMDSAETYMGVSLTNVKARILEMGGTMHIHSRTGQGTEVVLRVPLEATLELEKGGLI